MYSINYPSTYGNFVFNFHVFPTGKKINKNKKIKYFF